MKTLAHGSLIVLEDHNHGKHYGKVSTLPGYYREHYRGQVLTVQLGLGLERHSRDPNNHPRFWAIKRQAPAAAQPTVAVTDEEIVVIEGQQVMVKLVNLQSPDGLKFYPVKSAPGQAAAISP